MEPSDIRKRVLQMLERARRRAIDHREETERSSKAFEQLLPRAALAWKQVVNILRADGHGFELLTPSGELRVVSDRSPGDFIEVALDSGRRPVAVVVRTRLARGGRIVDRETIVVEGAAVLELDEERLLDTLLAELEPFVER